MSAISINEPQDTRRMTMLTPQSINEPIGVDGVNIPRITGVDPAGCAAGDEPMVVTVSGMYMPPTAVVTISGTPLPTTFVSAEELFAELDPSGATAGGYPVTIQVGGLEAHPAVMFTVTEAAARKGKR